MPGYGCDREVLGVALVLAAVPEQLRELQHDLLVDRVGVRHGEDGGELVPVDRPVQQHAAVVHARHAQDGPAPLGRERGDGPAHDAALAVAHEVAVVRLEQRLAAGLERGIRDEARIGVDQPTEELEVHETLEHVVDLGVERRHVDAGCGPRCRCRYSDMPTQSVAHPIRSCATPAENEPPSTSPASPRRPCP